MPVRTVMFRLPIPDRCLSHTVLLAGVSVAALLIGATQLASARPLGGGASQSAPVNATASAMAGAQQAATAAAQALASMQRATQAVQAMRAVQAAARAAAANGPSNLGVSPNNPQQILPNVPNGLTPQGSGTSQPSGLQIAPGVGSDPTLWQNANLPTQSTANGQTTVGIRQTGQKSILTWSTFNVGQQTTVQFDQSAGKAVDGNNNWIAFNRVIDPSGLPSQILGQIRAEGSVYLINANGIIFGGSSQVNTHSLIASSLPIFRDASNPAMTPGSTAYNASVLASNTTFLTSGIEGFGNDPFLGSNAAPLATVRSYGDISIRPGASIAVGDLGFALLSAPNVANQGQLTTNGGQIVLAAGMGVGVRQSNNTTSGSLAQLQVFVTGATPMVNRVDTTPLFTATNTGLIDATTGNVTMIGYAVTQAGVVRVTIGVTRPGSITLIARDEYTYISGVESVGRAGPMTFTPQSVTSIFPEENGETTTSSPTATAQFRAGSASLTAGSVTFQGDGRGAGALFYAPGANVTISQPVGTYSAAPSDPTVPGRIFIDSGVTIDVAGLPDVKLPVSDNLVTIGPITANDLADAPVQRNGFLFSRSIVVDSRISGVTDDGRAWVGSPLINGLGYVQNIPRRIDQLLVNGGSLTLNATEVITAPGSVLNLAGGYVHYLGGKVATTRLLGADGHLYSVANADPNIAYVGFAGQFNVDHARWGVREIYSSSLISGGHYESDYIQGGNAGALSIASTSGVLSGTAILDGEILARAQAGQRQVAKGVLPSGGSLTLNPFQAIAFASQSAHLADIVPNFNATTSLATPAMLARSADDLQNVRFTSTLSTEQLAAAGFSSISVTTNNNRISVEQGATLSVQPGGKITFGAATVAINGNLIAPSGQIAVTSTGLTTTIYTSLLPDPKSTALPIPGDITVGSGAVISTAGLWVNDAQASADRMIGNAAIDGGTISFKTNQSSGQQLLSGDRQFGGAVYGSVLDTTGSIILQTGSLLDVSSGGYVQRNGLQQTANGVPSGRGGSISLALYTADTLGNYFGGFVAPGLPEQQPTGGRILLGGALRGYGFSGGGMLSLRALGVQIGGDPASVPDYMLALPARFFESQGFGSYNLTALYDATVVAGTTITPTQLNFIPAGTALLQAPTGTSLFGAGVAQPGGALVTLGQLDSYRRQPTNFSLSAGDYLNWRVSSFLSPVPPTYPNISGTLLLDKGASIVADAGANVTLSSAGQLTDFGAITASGGSIALSALFSYGTDASSRSIWLGSQARLDVSGTVLYDPLAAPVPRVGLAAPRTGKVLPGGSVVIGGTPSYLIAEAGSVINVSGASGIFDLPTGAPASPSFRSIYTPSSYAPTPIWSDAGQVVLAPSSGLYFDGTLVAQGGAAQAQGGRLSIGDGFAGILLQQSGALVPKGLRPGDTIEPSLSSPSTIEHFAIDRLNGSGITQLVLGANPNTFNPGASSLIPLSPTAAGNGPITIGFAGDVNLSLGQSVIANAANFVAMPSGTMTLPGLAGAPLLSAELQSVGGATVSIAAPYVQLGGNNSSQTTFQPVLALGDGQLNVTAVSATGTPGAIDLVGQFGLQNFGQTNFTTTGDIRFYTPVAFAYKNGAAVAASGELVTAGNLTFTAAQLYPATANAFNIVANAGGLTDADGNAITTTIAVRPNGPSVVPLSAAGALRFDANTIIQSGTIRAPSGSITLGVSDVSSQTSAFGNLPLVQTQTLTLAAGSLSSVSLDGAAIPYGVTIDGTDFQYQVYNPGYGTPAFPNLTSPPIKAVSLGGLNIALNSGATIDLSGGGDLYAQEWVPGTGGTRDVLRPFSTSYLSGATPTQVSLFPDSRPIYAIVPGFGSTAAPYDSAFVQPGSVVGQSVYLSGAPGLTAGTYTLLPGQYATLPGAFRVVQNTSVSDAQPRFNATLGDGTNIVAGRFVNTLTGVNAARTTSFAVQPSAVWRQYSEYALTSANRFFPALAASNGNPAPRLPVDAGLLSIAAVNGLNLDAILNTSAPGGRGAQVDIASQDIQIVGSGESVRPGYLQISASALNALGAESLLIGGTRSETAAGVTLTARANSVVVSTGAANPLLGPEIILLTGTDPSGVDPNAATGLLVESGSVIRAQGAISASADLPISIGSTTVSGNGALLRVSNGVRVPVARVIDATRPLGLLTLQDGVTIDGGASLTLNSAGDTLVASGAILSARSIDAAASLITFTNQNNALGNGLVIGPNTLAQLRGASEIILQSSTAIDFAGDVAVALNSGSLKLGAGAFTSSTGSAVTISAPNVVFTNLLGAQPGVWSGPNSGSLTINTGELDFGSGQAGSAAAPITSRFYGFSSVTANATGAVVGQGTGGVLDFGSTPVRLNTPLILADSGSNQTLQTTGAFVLSPLATAPLQRVATGGAITLIGGTLRDGVAIAAPSGNVSLRTTSGDLLLVPGVTVSVAGLAKQFYDVTLYAPAGAISLTADRGSIIVPAGATLDFSAATDGGDAGSLSISAPAQVATLAGTIKGSAAKGFAGGSFSIDTGGAADLDALAHQLSSSGVTSLISVHTRSGNLALSQGARLAATAVSLTADGGNGTAFDAGNGNVNILGTIDASGPAGGNINLYGKSSVAIDGALLAVGTDPAQLGGVVNIGTSGAPDGTLNPVYGYQNVTAANSGRIVIGANALIDVGGGSALTLASNNLIGGVINLRAPLLNDGDVNVAIANPASLRGARAVGLEAYAVWSTTDGGGATGPKHFDGFVDPAGWYDNSGALVSGAFKDQSGNLILDYQGGSMTAAQLSPYLTQNYFTPTMPNADHQTFYGYVHGNAALAAPGTLMGFVRAPGFTFENRFASVANFQARPGIELDNPNPAINNGAISVLTNWNLGAVKIDANGVASYAYRYGTQAPIVTLRASGDVKVAASISDGFYQYAGSGNPFTPVVTAPSFDDANNAYAIISYYNNFFARPGAFTDLQGNSVDLSAHYVQQPASPTALGLSASNPQNNYFQLYQLYTGAFDNLYNLLDSNNGKYAAPGQIPQTPPVPPVAPAPSSDFATYGAAYAAYIAQYTDFAAGSYYSSYNRTYRTCTICALPAPIAPPALISFPLSVTLTTYDNTPSPVATPANPAPLQVANLAPNIGLAGGSSSYRFVAGADFNAVNPLAIKAGISADFILDGHFSAVDPNNRFAAPSLLFPNMIRTGTGSIDIVAPHDVALRDQVAPGVIYTAGTPAAGTFAGTDVRILQRGGGGLLNVEIITTGAVNPVAGGNISIAAGRDVVGIEQVFDPDGSVSGTQGAYIGQFWWPWMQSGNPTVPGVNENGSDVRVGVSSSINFGAFSQGILSAGGNVSINAGRNVRDLAVSLPTTWYLTDSTGAQVRTYTLDSGVVATPGLVVNTVGGGNLIVNAGNDILSGSYFVARGNGSITAGGGIGSDFTFAPVNDSSYNTGLPFVTPVSTLLALQDSVMKVSARQTVDIGGIYNPSYNSTPLMMASDSQSYSARSSVSVTSTTGDVRLNTLSLPETLFNYGPPNWNDTYAPLNYNGVVLPASLSLAALNGGISIQAGGELYPSASGQLNLIADRTIQLYNDIAGATSAAFGLSDQPASFFASPLAQYNRSRGGDLVRESKTGLHLLDSEPVRVYSLNGDIIAGSTNPKTGFFANALALVPNKPAVIQAGNDIVNLSLIGQHFYQSDVTRVIAGHDIYDTPLPLSYAVSQGLQFNATSFVPVLALGGPGTFDVQAGRNIGPLTSANEAIQQGYQYGLFGNGQLQTGIQTIGNLFNRGLPPQSANIDVLFGVGPGIDDRSFANAYLDPASNLPGTPDFSSKLVAFVSQYQSDQAKRSGVTATGPALTPGAAWAAFQTLPRYQQRLFAERTFFQILDQTGLDYNDPTSAYFNQYARGYQAINTLFPAAYGYTANNLGGGANGANALVSTGYLDMRGSSIQTQQGGDVSILGPGGRILVGSSSAPPFIVDQTGRTLVGPSNQGILTLETGNVNIFSDQSVLLAQSRIFTEQGGDILIWSSNGDINAGKGVKTTSEVPPPQYTCDVSGYCTVDAGSQVTGAGIASIQTKPNAPAGNANLIAPRGTVDAGAAGIRVSGNLNIAALFVANAFNIQVQGVSIGVPTVGPTNVGALTTASNTAAASQQAVAPAQSSNSNQASIIIVEVLGFGGGDNDPDLPSEEDKRRQRSDSQSQDPRSRYQVVGAGAVSEDEARQLAAEKQRRLGR